MKNENNKFIKIRTWYNKQKCCYAPRIGIAINNFCIHLYGFEKKKGLYPYKSMCVLSISFKKIQYNFRIGIQNKTWFYVVVWKFKKFTCDENEIIY
jgi:hypothetical protein